MNDWPLLVPELVATGFLVLMILSEFGKRLGAIRRVAPTAAFNTRPILFGCLVLFIAVYLFGDKVASGFQGTFIVDPFAGFFKGFFAFTVFFVTLMARVSWSAKYRSPDPSPDDAPFFLTLWTSLIGLFFLVSANDLLLLFISLEVMTLSLYIMAAYRKHELFSIEAGLKYLIMGSLASAFILFGISQIYVATGSTLFIDVRSTFAANPNHPLMLLGILCVLSGFLFKAASVPFQFWVPDVYQGAPTPVVAYLAAASKAAGFAVLMRLLFTVFGAFDARREPLFSAFAAMTLLYGNLGALLQTDIKRLLGYSSIGHAGYLLVGLAAGGDMGVTAVLYYLAAYAFSTLTAFLAVTLVERESNDNQLSAYRGLAKRSPILAGSLFVALLSLAGAPPLAGFFGKFLVLLAAARAGIAWLALLGSLAVVISLYYYLSVVRVMYIEEPLEKTKIEVPPSVRISLILLSVGIVLIGFFQAPVLALAQAAARSLF